jgi:hypothetical protein
MDKKSNKNRVQQESADSRLTPHPDPKDPHHVEWLIDEADEESFPASDPSAVTQPRPRPGKA